jgi:hypothetical protein
MKKQELKRLIKPVVKECIHEVLLEEGLLSNVVSEVVRGMSSAPLVEATPPPQTKRVTQEQKNKISEHRQRMMEAIGRDAYNGIDLFEGTTDSGMEQPKAGTPDLGAPTDPGVDISSILGDASRIWQSMK